jgi:hypothetical protein
MARAPGASTSRPSERTEGERREQARARARGKAQTQGEMPRSSMSRQDFEWAFEGCEAELREIEDVAREARKREVERHRKRDARRELAGLTESILNERREKRAREERESAEGEARRRLELD